MITTSIISLITLLVLLYVYARISFASSLLIVSTLSICTFSGVVSSSGFILYFFSLVNYIAFSKVRLKYNHLIVYIIFLVVLLPILLLSTTNGATELKSFLKFFQSAVAIFGLIFIAMNAEPLDSNVMKKLCTSFVIVNIAFGLIFHFIFDAYDLGLIRFSGIFFDSNYYGLYCLVLYFGLDFSNDKNVILKFTLGVLLVSSLSLSIFTIFIFYLLSSKQLPKFLLKWYSFLGVIIITMVTYLALMLLLKELASESISNQFLLYKLSSMMQRLSAQFEALEILKSYDAYLSGVGSGRNIELTGRALHHSFLQMLFSHGLLYFFLMVTILAISLKGNYGNIVEKRKYFSIYYSLLLACYVLDPYATLYFNVTAFIFYSFRKNIHLSTR